MSSRQLIRIALALAGVLIVWGLLALSRRGSRDRLASLSLPRVAAADVDSVVMTHDSVAVHLVRRGKEWEANGYPAAEASVGDFLASLADSVAPSELVTESAASHARLGLDSASGRRLQVFSRGTRALDLMVGNHGPGFEGMYLRRTEGVSAYLTRARYATFAARSVEDWRDHRVAAIVPDSVSAVEVSRGKRSYRLMHGKGWSFAGGGPADSAAVARFLAGFRVVTASGFPGRAQADSLTFRAPARHVRLLRTGGSALLSLAFDSTKGGFWVRADSGGTIYRLEAWSADQLTPADSTFRPGKKQQK